MIRTLILALFLLLSDICCAQRVVVSKAEYWSVWNVATQTPAQVYYVLHHDDLGSSKRCPNWRFIKDIDTPFMIVKHSDYTNSGYHRGHMCPAKDRSMTEHSMKETFCMSNVAPQTPSLNMGAWKQTEDWIRGEVCHYDSLGVLICPVYLQRDTIRFGDAPVCVPHAYFKAVWDAANDSVINAWFIFNK